MTFYEYRQELMRFVNPALTKEENTENAIYGMIGEFGEVCDLLKKHRFQGHPLDIEHLKKELGDLMWYVGLYINVCGYDYISLCNPPLKISDTFLKQFPYDVLDSLYDITYSNDIDGYGATYAYRIMCYCEQLCSLPEININFENVLESNIAKLSARYPNGFTTEASMHRKAGDI